MCGITQPPSNDYYCLSEIYGRFYRTSHINNNYRLPYKLFTPYFSLKISAAVRKLHALLGHTPRVFSPNFLLTNNAVAVAIEARPTPRIAISFSRFFCSRYMHEIFKTPHRPQAHSQKRPQVRHTACCRCSAQVRP